MTRILPLTLLTTLGYGHTYAQQVSPAPPASPLPAHIAGLDSPRTATGKGGDTLRCTTPGVKITTAEWQAPAVLSIQPLLSRVAGVQVTPYSGAPGAWATVRIRGVANVTGNEQPLYVVDGVPIYNTDVMPERWGVPAATPSPFTATATPGTPTANPLLDLPVEEVEKIEMVYGAGATARYGMQGSSGVILITTRQGAGGLATPQAPRLRYAGWAGVQQVRQRYDLLDAHQYATLANEAAAVTGRPARYTADDLAHLGEVDWQDRRLRLGAITGHNLSLDGLTAHHTRYYVAADYLRQAGVVDQSGLTRYQLRTNLDQQITSRLSLGLKASASQIDQYYAGPGLDAGLVLREALLAAPALWPDQATPTQQFDFNARTPRTRRLLVQLNATYQFSPVLSLSLRGSREQAQARTLGYSRDAQQPTAALAQTSTATTSMHSWVADAALRYQRTFGTAHALTAALTYQRQEFDRDWGQALGTAPFLSTSTFSEKSRPVHSPAAAVGYTYAGRYEAQGWLRYDFIRPDADAPAKYQYRYWSPGGQLSWHLHKEAFLADANLSDLTLYVGAGKTGSSLASAAFFSFAPPAQTVQQDAGLRLGVLGGRLTLNVAAYQRRTRHAQTILSLLTSTGAGGTQTFYSELPDLKLLNQGLTVALGSTWRRGALIGISQLAAAANRNEVEDLGFNTNGNAFVVSQGLEVGQPLGRYYVLEQDGTYPAGTPQAGQIRFRDRNHDGRVDYADGYYTGSNLPRYTLSYCQQLHLRRFQLDAQLDGLFGYSILNTTLLALDMPSGYTNNSTLVLDRWMPTHQDTSVPQAGTYQAALSNQSLASGNHVRLSQLTLSYEVLSTDARKVSVWVGGQNLFVTGAYRGFDPNVSSGGAAPLQAGQDASVYPVARVWQVGVRGQF